MERKPLLQDSDKEYNTFMNSSGHDHRRHGAKGTEYNVNADVSRGAAACDLPSLSDSQNSNIKARNNGHSRRAPDGHQERRLRSPCQDFNESENSVSEDAQKVHAEDGEVIKNQKTRMFLLVLIGFLASCASKIDVPVMTQYTYQVYTEQVFGNLSAGVHISKQPCVNSSYALTSSDTQQVQDQSGDFLSRTTLIGGGVAIFTNLFLGSYSDVMGRKLVLLLPIFGHFLRDAAVPIIIYFDLGLPGMYVGYLLDGLFGGFSAFILGLYVYAADITKTGGQRTMSLALVEMSIGLGQCCLNVVAGFFIEEMGFFYPSLAASSLILVCVFLICLLPETVPRDRKKLISPIKAFRRVIGTFLPRDNVYRRAMLLVGITAFFITTLPVYCTETVSFLRIGL
ncbi:hypothetical protein V1264_001926 [Littorina saxatilis]|uniref:Proton-coupled folate transporter n=1 Tax=Littorina saxatilis TaxID=31220 RepID=A0AAN9C2J2_9CAEN